MKDQRSETTLVPMLIGRLLLVIVDYVAVMMFV